MWVLVIEPRSFGKEACAWNVWAITSTPVNFLNTMCYFYHFICYCWEKKHCLILFQRLSVYCFSWSFFPPVSVRQLHYLLDTVVLFLYLLFSLAEIGLHVWNIFFSTFLVFEGLMKSHSFLCDLQWRPLFWHSLWQLSFVVFVLL